MTQARWLFFSLSAVGCFTVWGVIGALFRWLPAAAPHWLMWCLNFAPHRMYSAWHLAALAALTFCGLFLIRTFIPFLASALIRRQEEKTIFLSKNLRIVQSSKMLAHVCGLFQPKIVLSTAALKKLTLAELEGVLRHEYYHLKHHHSIKIWLLRLISQVFWFLPALRQLTTIIHAELENQADSWAALTTSPRFLANALSKFATIESTLEIGFSSPRLRNQRKVEWQHFWTTARNLIFLSTFLTILWRSAHTAQASLQQPGLWEEHNRHCQQRPFSPGNYTPDL